MNNVPSESILPSSLKDIEFKEQDKVTKITTFHVFLLFCIKIITSLFSKSMSFFSELSDSILDFAALFITYVGLKESRKNADYHHMFGHYKINSAAGMVQSLLIIGMYVYIFWTSLKSIYLNLFLGEPYQTENSLIQVFILIIILGIVYYDSALIIRIGKKQNNTLIIAQGQNFRSDFYRNVSFIIGLIIASIGFPIMDLILASIFSIRSIVNGFTLLRRSFDELIDSNIIKQDDIEEVERLIKIIPDVHALDLFAIRTNGNRLDCHVMVRIDQQISVFGGNLIADQIRALIQKKFGDHFICNVFVQFNLENPSNEMDLNNIFEYIRDIGLKDQEIHNIHNINIDEYQDKIVVKYHIDLNPEIELVLGHKIATELEHHMENTIRTKFNTSKLIQVISHIEPIKTEKKSHSHKITRLVPNELRENILKVINLTQNVKGVRDLQVQLESEGVYIIVKVLLAPHINIALAHEITNQIEYNIWKSIKNVRYCLVHPEPLI